MMKNILPITILVCIVSILIAIFVYLPGFVHSSAKVISKLQQDANNYEVFAKKGQDSMKTINMFIDKLPNELKSRSEIRRVYLNNLHQCLVLNDTMMINTQACLNELKNSLK